MSEETRDQWRLKKVEEKVFEDHEKRIGDIEKHEEKRDVMLEAVKAVAARQTAVFGGMIVGVVGSAIAVIIAGAH